MKALEHREIQLGLLEILKGVDEFCRERGLRYSLAYGSLLGAVRHKGFIPWDDDIDILMPRPDFERFVREFKHPLYVCHKDSEKFTHYFAKVEDPSTVCEEKKLSRKLRLGLNIDVFPVDGKPDTVEEQTAHEKRIGKLVRRIFIRRRGFFSLHDLNLAKIEAHLHSTAWWVDRAEALMKEYDFASCASCGSICTTYSGLIEIFPRSLFENYTTLEFEGLQFPVFEDWESFLKQQYGDYMKLPPEDKRKIHHRAVYRK